MALPSSQFTRELMNCDNKSSMTDHKTANLIGYKVNDTAIVEIWINRGSGNFSLNKIEKQ